MKSIIDKINEFESGTEHTVEAFNLIFQDCPIEWNNPKAEVEVLGVVGPHNVRDIRVDGCRKRHEFVLPVSNGTTYHDNEELVPFEDNRKSLKDYPTNENTENIVLSSKELSLCPHEYFILQYLRGCESPYHTYVEISKKLNLADKTVVKYAKQMAAKGILQVSPEIRGHRVFIKIDNAWE